MHLFRVVAWLLVGSLSLVLAGCDSGGETSSGNSPPTLTSVPSDDSITAESTYQAQVEAEDPDGDPITFRLFRAPQGAEIGSSSGQITWTPTAEQADSTYTLELRVTDGEASTEGSFVLTVPSPSTSFQVTADPSTTHQEMIGFGGALTWWSDQIISNSNTQAIADLLFEDLGTDILRLKNWYYPTGYPDDKTPDEMEVDFFKDVFDATNQFYDLAKERNEDIDILLSSWGPPSSLKSNGELEEGTLARDAETGAYRYGDFAQYWVDILDHISFTPQFISIQNEPDFVSPDWETSEWRPTETSNFPGYEAGIDSVHQRLQGRQDPPTFIGPEAASLPGFSDFAEVVRDKSYVDMYAYHVYNFNESTSVSEMSSQLADVPADYGDKPNIMTEYSGLSWLKTARLINSAVVDANAAGYIYWEMWWGGDGQGAEQAMVRLDGNGGYETSPFYYVMKHFAKHVDEGYDRVTVSSEDEALELSGYRNPAGDELTLVLINSSSTVEKTAEITVEGNGSVQSTTVVQSQSGAFYQEVEDVNIDEGVFLPPSSITTVVLEL